MSKFLILAVALAVPALAGGLTNKAQAKVITNLPDATVSGS
jgi:hypothetical protein